MSPLRLATAALALALAALATPGAAHAQPLDVELSFVPPGAPYTGEQQPLDSEFTLVITYNFKAHTWSGVELTLALPNKLTHPRIVIGTDSETGDTFASSALIAGEADTLRWVGTPAANTAISGQIFVRLTAQAWAQTPYGPSIDGTPYDFTATLVGYVDGSPTLTTDSATGRRTGVGAADVKWQYAGQLYGTGPNYAPEAMLHQVTGEPGVLFRYNYRVYNCGTNPVDAGGTMTITVGSALQVARHWAGNNTGAYPGSFAPSVGPLVPPGTDGEIWSTTPGTPAQLSITHPYRLDAPSNCGYTTNYYVDLWASCQTLADRVAAAQANQPLTPWQIAGVATLYEPHFGQPSTLTTAPAPTTPTTIPALTCGGGGTLVKSGDHNPPAGPNNVSLDAEVAWTITFESPTGVASIDDFALVDILPGRGTTTSFLVNTLFTDRGLTPYFCTHTPGVFLTPAQVATLIGSSCLPAITVSDRWRHAPSQDPALVTHFALVGDYAPPANAEYGLTKSSLSGRTYVPTSFDSSVGPDFALLRNRAYLTGQADLDFDPDTAPTTFGDAIAETGTEDPFEDVGSAHVIDYACPSVPLAPSGQGSALVAPGDCTYARFVVRSNIPYRAGTNVSVQVTMPDGVTVVDTLTSTNMCIEDPDGTFIEPLDFSDPTLTWQLGTADAPCSLFTNNPWVQVDFCVDEDHPFENGQTFDVRIDLLDHAYEPPPGTSCPAGLPTTSTWTYTMLVPGEMSAAVAPICRTDGAISFVSTARNTGGMDLSDVLLAFELPSIANGSDADTTYLGIDAIDTGGQPYIVQASSDGLDWSLSPTPGDPAVRFLRLLGTATGGLKIDALTGAPITFEVLLASPAVSGDALYGGGTLDALTGFGALPTADAAANQPYVVGGCKELRVVKFFDADGDGQQGPGEPLLSGWTFAVDNADGAPIAEGTTDASGTTTFLLALGDYTVTELPRDTAPSTWSITTPADAVADATTQVSIALAAEPPDLLFGNVCRCPDGDADLCTGRCLADGTCDDTFTVTCDDGEQCTLDACDPTTGLCGAAPKPCDAIDYYVAVSDADGTPAGTIHCVLQAGEAPICDTDQDGHLRIWPLGTPTMQTCGGLQVQ